MTTTGVAHFSAAQEDGVVAVRTQVKRGLLWAQQHPYAAYGIGASALLLFPGPRSYIYRNLIGSFRSQESLFRSATEQSEGYKASVEALLAEKEVATAKAAAALDALNAATSNAAAAKSVLASLSERMAATAAKMKETTTSLKVLKAEEAVTLRADLARDTAALATEQKAAADLVAQMSNKGL